MIILKNRHLEFHFPEVHPQASCSIRFHRTLRIPDDNRSHPLPPSLGEFPLLHLEDYADKVPSHWNARGGVFFPMYQSEAMWISFAARNYPCAVKIAAGKINVVTGETWTPGLGSVPQDYIVAPNQPWIDGFCVAKGLIRQFVAMPLGEGFSAEEQLTGEGKIGGLQISVYPMKQAMYNAWLEQERLNRAIPAFICACVREPGVEMALAPGGIMKQKLYEDPLGLNAWDEEAMARCFVHLVNSEQFFAMTGHAPPNRPPSAKTYTKAGLPWFEYFAADQKVLAGAKPLARLDSVAARKIKVQQPPLVDNEPVAPTNIVELGTKNQVRDGLW